MKYSLLAQFAVLCSVAVLSGGIAVGETNAPPVRLAVIAEGNSVECRNLADLLQVELSKRDDLELVEREEIDRVLAEQALTASALVAESQRVRLGAILRAKGLLFIGQTNPTNGVFQVRLVETRHGFVAGFIVHEATTPLPQTQAAVDRATANLSLPPDEQVGVSMLVINNGLPGNLKTRPIVQEFMEGIEQRVMVELASMPGTLILERRKLDDVAREDDLTGKASSFMAGTLLIDGGLNPAADLTAEKDDPPIVLTLRLRNLATGTTKIVKVEGGLLSLRSLEQKALSDLFGVAMAMRAEAGSGTLKAEAKVLDKLVARYGLSWANEAALAMDATDRKRVQAHISLVTAGFERLPDDRAKAITLAKIETICRQHKIALVGALNCFSESFILDYLKLPETFVDPELYRLLQPLREKLLSEFDRAAVRAETALTFDVYVKWLPGILLEPSGRKRHVIAWSKCLQENPKTSDSMRYFISTYLLYVYRWGTDDLTQFRSSHDPVCRFHANRALLKNARSRQQQLEYSHAMIEDLEAFIDRMKGMSFGWHFLHTGSGVGVSGKRYTPNRWASEALRDLYRYRPEFKETVQRKLFERMKGFLEEKNFGAIDFLEYDVMLTTIPERELFDWMSGVLEHRAACSNTQHLVRELERWRAQILSRHPEFLAENKLPERVLLSAQSHDAQLRRLARPPADADRREKVSLERIFVDGDTLWVGVKGGPVAVRSDRRQWYEHAGGDVNRQWFYLLGVLEIDLPTGQVKSERAQWFSLDSDDSSAISFCSLGNMFRLGEYLVMHHTGLGLVAIPVQESGMGNWRVFGSDEGLPSHRAPTQDGFEGTLAGMRRGVCLALQKWIVYWDFDTWKSRVVLDVDEPATSLGYEDSGKYIMGLKTNPQTDEMWLNLAVVIGTRQTALSASSGATPKNFYRKGLQGEWQEIEEDDQPPRSKSGQDLDRARQFLQDGMVSSVRDVAIWGDEIIALYGPDNENVKVSVFSRVVDGAENEK